MVKERSYKILEQLDEFELQDAGESSMGMGYQSESDSEDEARKEPHGNVVPSAMDSDGDDRSDDEVEYSDSTGMAAVRQREVVTGGESAQIGAAEAASSSLAAVTSAASGHVVPNPTDGVFANMSAKPELYLGYDDKVPNEALPTYQDIYGVASTSAPPYFETAVISVSDEDELLVEGLPVGSLGVFVVNMIVSTAFQVVGYMLTFLLHSSHAAKNGSLAGLGITFMNFGFYIRTHLGQPMMDDGSGNDHGGAAGDAPFDSDTPLDNAYFAYLLMVVGAGIFLKSVFDYVRVRRLQTIIESSPELNV
ncbi:hypothetical protein BX661DRAFT_184007 [Kickxella alabastrina]|uniref:uncharacterized protein n=1 Tax=Kickxella alabastrina TaxID=61397 RepID=UPI00221E980C|nr:uncharacterized protein BX661DRAFT_184007 [Kickxella alabastrina]KAI7826425.1 hypothetical protein BX661DRAFT_184007 [Kickxella alabastrina]KAJ1937868.1 hypothetical protein GGF37_005034 [Kickxella alabastrina]